MVLSAWRSLWWQDQGVAVHARNNILIVYSRPSGIFYLVEWLQGGATQLLVMSFIVLRLSIKYLVYIVVFRGIHKDCALNTVSESIGFRLWINECGIGSGLVTLHMPEGPYWQHSRSSRPPHSPMPRRRHWALNSRRRWCCLLKIQSVELTNSAVCWKHVGAELTNSYLIISSDTSQYQTRLQKMPRKYLIIIVKNEIFSFTIQTGWL